MFATRSSGGRRDRHESTADAAPPSARLVRVPDLEPEEVAPSVDEDVEDPPPRKSDIRELRPVRQSEDVAVVKVTARRLDEAAEPALRSAFLSAWNRGITVLVVDLSDVVYVDSLGLSALIALQRSRPSGTRIVVAGMCDFVRDIFEVTQAVHMFDVYASAQAALLNLAA